MKPRRNSNKILSLYKFLKKKYGKPTGQWSLWSKRPKTGKEKEQIIIESILTQRTNWRNVQIAMAKLKSAKADSLKGICKFKNKNELALLIKSSGFYKQKTKYLVGLAKFVLQSGGVKKLSKIAASSLRLALCDLKGVGPETADSILLYALEKPVFVVDEYTRRLLITKGIEATIPCDSRHKKKRMNYEEIRELFEKNLPRDWRLYQDFHALIVIDGKRGK
ncbi:endonuclease [Candidatus Wolfebacteria bacterium]|nr:endonuclease [Candidatus Wolfebacteria bacterium]